LALAPAATVRFGFYGFVLAYAAAVLAWLPLHRRSLPLGITIAIAIVLRGIYLLPDPHLSGDVYRYLSDGRVLASGHNPYTYTPTDPRINHREIHSIYPPHAQLLFALVHNLTAWRLLILAADIAAIVLLRRYDAALAFATCPLVIVEGVWSGHIDALAGVLVAFALAYRSGVALGIAAGLKVIPLAALPALFCHPERSEGAGRVDGASNLPPTHPGPSTPLGMTIGSFLAALLLPILPFLGGPIMPGFRDYATRWVFSSPLYELVYAIVDRIPTKDIWTSHPLRFQFLSDFVYRHLYPDFLTRAILAVIALGGILLARRVTTAIAILLVCSPAIHPWYWLTLIPVALMERSRWLYLALAMPLSYLLYE